MLAFAVLLVITGATQPPYCIGSDKILADLLEPDEKRDSYALLRLFHNLGVIVRPAIGWFLAARSYTQAYYGAGIGMISYGMFLAFFVVEKLPRLI